MADKHDEQEPRSESDGPEELQEPTLRGLSPNQDHLLGSDFRVPSLTQRPQTFLGGQPGRVSPPPDRPLGPKRFPR